MTLTEKQQNLLCGMVPADWKNTHQIAESRGDAQAYETCLRDRLFRLASKGLVYYYECVGQRSVTERRWYVSEAGLDRVSHILEQGGL